MRALPVVAVRDGPALQIVGVWRIGAPGPTKGSDLLFDHRPVHSSLDPKSAKPADALVLCGRENPGRGQCRRNEQGRDSRALGSDGHALECSGRNARRPVHSVEGLAVGWPTKLDMVQVHGSTELCACGNVSHAEPRSAVGLVCQPADQEGSGPNSCLAVTFHLKAHILQTSVIRKSGGRALLGRAAPDAVYCPKPSKLKRTMKITAAPASDVPDSFSCIGELLTAMPVYP